MSLMPKKLREELDRKYDLIICTITNNPEIFFSEIQEKTGIHRTTLRKLLQHLVETREIMSKPRYNPRNGQIGSLYSISVISNYKDDINSDPEGKRCKKYCVGVDQDDLDWMEKYRHKKFDRLRLMSKIGGRL